MTHVAILRVRQSHWGHKL